MMDVSIDYSHNEYCLIPEQGGASAYNDNKGIKMHIEFTPLPSAPSKDGKRPRSNAKPKTITKIRYFHEECALRDVIVNALQALNRIDLLEWSQLYREEEFDEGNSFSLFYTISRRVTKQVEINGQDDFKQMVEEATHKATAEVKLFFTENKVSLEYVRQYCSIGMMHYV